MENWELRVPGLHFWNPCISGPQTNFKSMSTDSNSAGATVRCVFPNRVRVLAELSRRLHRAPGRVSGGAPGPEHALLLRGERPGSWGPEAWRAQGLQVKGEKSQKHRLLLCSKLNTGAFRLIRKSDATFDASSRHWRISWIQPKSAWVWGENNIACVWCLRGGHSTFQAVLCLNFADIVLFLVTDLNTHVGELVVSVSAAGIWRRTNGVSSPSSSRARRARRSSTGLTDPSGPTCSKWTTSVKSHKRVIWVPDNPVESQAVCGQQWQSSLISLHTANAEIVPARFTVPSPHHRNGSGTS